MALKSANQTVSRLVKFSSGEQKETESRFIEIVKNFSYR